jgi:flagellin-like protein
MKKEAINHVFLLKNRKGISPVIATVLLIAMVLVIGLIVFMWFRGLTQEAVTKFEGENIELACDDVNFVADYNGGLLFISNTGNVPIYEINLKILKEGSHQTKNLKDLSINWPDLGLNQGGTFSGYIADEVVGANEIIVIPILLGKSEQGEKTFVCDEQFGYNIII